MTAPSKVARVYPPIGRYPDVLYNRDHADLVTAAGGLPLLPADLVWCTDIGRLCLQYIPIAGSPHYYGPVADAAALLTIHAPDLPIPRYVLPGDTARVGGDTGPIWQCITGNGLADTDWAEISGDYQAAGDYQPLAAELTALAAGASTAYGRSLLALPDVAALRAEAVPIPAEPALGLPAESGYMLTSSAAGVRSWVPVPSGGGLSYYPGPLVLGSGDYQYESLTSTSGLFAQLGIAAGGGTWINPHTAGAITVVFSAGWINAVEANLVARSTSGYPVGSGTASWLGVDIGAGRAIAPRSYLLQGGPYAGRVICNFILEGSNNVGANTEAGFNAATWATIDTRTNDTTLARTTTDAIAKFSCAAPAASYRWFRWRQTGLDGLGENYFPLCEIELYDTDAITAPEPYTGWATDGLGHYSPYLFAE